MVRRGQRRLADPEPLHVPMGALSQDERGAVRAALGDGEQVLTTVRAWDGETRLAWVLTDRRVLVAQVEVAEVRVMGLLLEEVTRLDLQPAGVGSAIWLYTDDQLYGLHLANDTEAEGFVSGFEQRQRDAMVLRIVP